MLTYDLSDRGELSLYECLYRHIRDDILSGSLLPDEKLPSKRGLAAHLGTSVITVEGAYRQLMAEGYIVSRERSGYYVRSISVRSSARKVKSGRSLQNVRVFDVADFSESPRVASHSFARLWEKALRDTMANMPQYELFARQPAQGSYRLRRSIASWLGQARGIEVNPDRIVVAAGAPVLYSLIALMTGGGDVALESPGYPRLKSIYETLGKQAHAVPLDDEGINCVKLEKCGAQLVHVMPSHQFPTGRVTSIARRYELLSWASHEPDRFIIEDDYDWEFRLSGKPIPSLSSIDAEGKVIYLSTFTKSLGPSLRIAFGVFPPDLDEQLERVLGCFSSTVGTLEQIALAQLMESGAYERHVNRCRTKAKAARDRLIACLKESAVGDKLSFEEIDSGLHFVLAVDTKASADDIVKRAAERGVGLAPIDRYIIGPVRDHDSRVRFVMQYDGIGENAAVSAAEVIVDAISGCTPR